MRGDEAPAITTAALAASMPVRSVTLWRVRQIAKELGLEPRKVSHIAMWSEAQAEAIRGFQRGRHKAGAPKVRQ